MHSILVLEIDMELPEPFISLIRLLLLPPDEWVKARDKGKIPKPKPKLDATTLRVTQDILERRLALYPTSIQVRGR